MQLLSLALFPALAFALAQDYGSSGGSNTGGTSSSSSASVSAAQSTPVAAPNNHFVTVGAGGAFAFSPNNLTAAVGDTVQFEFFGPHSVAQSSFAAPCQPLAGGFFSGLQSDSTSQPSQAFTITITNASQPLWIYCTQVTHCQSGMAMVINGPTSGPNTLAAYQAAAKNANTGTPSSTGGGVFSALITASSTGSAPATSSSSAASPVKLGLGGLGVAGGALLFAAGLV